MKASVTYTKLASEKSQEEVKRLQKFIEDEGYLYHLNLYGHKEISKEADNFVKEAISKLDASMKGWKTVADGKETHYDIFRGLNGLEYSYTRYYVR